MVTVTMLSPTSNVPSMTLADEKLALTLESQPKSSPNAKTKSKYYNDWPNDQGVGIPSVVTIYDLGTLSSYYLYLVSYCGRATLTCGTTCHG